MRVYRVQWCKGIPYIEAGMVILCGKRKISRRIQFPHRKSTVPMSEGSETIVGAIEREILSIATLCQGSLRFGRRSRPPAPWLLAKCASDLLRLYRKLEKHRLVPRGTYERAITR